MQIEKQVCSFEQAKRLNELGVINPSPLFTYNVIMPDITGENYFYEVLHADQNPGTLHEYLAPAFTVAELGVMLGEVRGNISKLEGKVWHTEGIWGIHITGNTEAECRAFLLIHLLENYVALLEGVNERLAS